MVDYRCPKRKSREHVEYRDPATGYPRKPASRILMRERVPHGVAYHCGCECGGTWTMGLMVADEVADRIASL